MYREMRLATIFSSHWQSPYHVGSNHEYHRRLISCDLTYNTLHNERLCIVIGANFYRMIYHLNNLGNGFEIATMSTRAYFLGHLLIDEHNSM